MAIIYYPNSAFILQRTTSGSVYTEIVTSNAPNSIFFFDSASQLSAISASTMYVTASWAITASYAMNGGTGGGSSVSSSWASSSLSSSYALTASYISVIPSGSAISASYADTASYALNAAGGGLDILQIRCFI